VGGGGASNLPVGSLLALGFNPATPVWHRGMLRALRDAAGGRDEAHESCAVPEMRRPIQRERIGQKKGCLVPGTPVTCRESAAQCPVSGCVERLTTMAADDSIPPEMKSSLTRASNETVRFA
jgi:hypothetical protein